MTNVVNPTHEPAADARAALRRALTLVLADDWGSKRQTGKRCPICGGVARFEGGVWRCKCNDKGGGKNE